VPALLTITSVSSGDGAGRDVRVRPIGLNSDQRMVITFVPSQDAGVNDGPQAVGRVRYEYDLDIAREPRVPVTSRCDGRVFQTSFEPVRAGVRAGWAFDPYDDHGWCPGTWTGSIQYQRRTCTTETCGEETLEAVGAPISVAFAIRAGGPFPSVHPTYSHRRATFRLRFRATGIDAEGDLDVLHLRGPHGTRCAGGLIVEGFLGDSAGPQTVFLDPRPRPHPDRANTSSFAARKEGRYLGRWCRGRYRAWTVGDQYDHSRGMWRRGVTRRFSFRVG
jgi:hypothetical protein